MPESVERTPLAAGKAAGATALLIVDMLSGWDFPDGEALLQQAGPIAPRIAALKARCRAAGVPTIYANDNHGRWRSDFRQVVAMALADGSRGAAIGRSLAPDADDYFVLKPKHSAFYETPLDLLLRHLRVKRLVITGVASDQCVLFSAADAKMRDYDVSVPRDCAAAQTEDRHARAIRHFDDGCCANTVVSAELELPRPR